MQDFWAWVQSDRFAVAIAGAAGGAVRWMALREDFKSGLISVAIGFLAATYLYPLGLSIIAALLGNVFTTSSSQIAASGFVIGIAGVGLIGFIVDFVKRYQTDHLGGGKDE